MTKFQSLCIASILLIGLFHLNEDSQAQPIESSQINSQQPVITNIKTSPTLSADTNRPTTSTFPFGETIEIFFSVTDLPDGKKTTLILDIQNEFGESIVKPQSITLSVEEGGKAKYTFLGPANRLGYFEIQAKLSDGTPLSSLGSRPAGFISYAVVPDPKTRIDYGDKLSRFGMLGGFNTSALVIPYLGLRYMLSGYDWTSMEPEFSGQFEQNRNNADRAGIRYPQKPSEYEKPIFNGKEWTTYHLSILTNASLPIWALKANTEGTSCKQFGELNEQGITALPNFALLQAKAFTVDFNNQSSRYYQITWEPQPAWCFGGTPTGLVKIFAQSYAAIHQGDPHAIVAGPTLFMEEASAKQLEGLWDAGLGKYVDALSFHPYTQWPPETNGLPTILRRQLNSAAKAIGRPIPFIGTEHGFTSNIKTDNGYIFSRNSNLNKALGDVRTTLIMLGEGASLDLGFYTADFWAGNDPLQTEGYGFYWNLNPKIQFGTDKLGPKIIVPAYAAMTYFLDGTASEGALTNTKGTQMGYKFKKANATIDVVWDYGSPSSYKIPIGTKVCDWMGNCSEPNQSEITIGGAPTYFIAGNIP